jgi:hypothetical protein
LPGEGRAVGGLSRHNPAPSPSTPYLSTSCHSSL